MSKNQEKNRKRKELASSLAKLRRKYDIHIDLSKSKVNMKGAPKLGYSNTSVFRSKTKNPREYKN